MTGEHLRRIESLKFLDCRHCDILESDNICELIEMSPHLQILDLEGCYLISNKVLEVASKVTKQRDNNVILQISTRKTSIKINQFKNVSTNLSLANSFKYGNFPRCPYQLTNYFSEYYKPANYQAFLDSFEYSF